MHADGKHIQKLYAYTAHSIYTIKTVQYQKAYPSTHDLTERNDQSCKVYVLSEVNSTAEGSLRLLVNCDIKGRSKREECRRSDVDTTILL